LASLGRGVAAVAAMVEVVMPAWSSQFTTIAAGFSAPWARSGACGGGHMLLEAVGGDWYR
jgi:hypothetical protein